MCIRLGSKISEKFYISNTTETLVSVGILYSLYYIDLTGVYSEKELQLYIMVG